MASLYETLNQFNPNAGPGGDSVFGSGAYTPGLDTGTFTDPMKTAATTAVDAAAGVATGPWGTDAGLSPAGSSWQTPTARGGGGSGGGDSKSGFGWNLGTLDVAIGGLKTLAGIWQAWEQNKIAKEQLAMQRGLTNANLANQVMAYNTTLEDRIANRVESGGWAPSRGSNFLSGHKLANVQV